MRALEKACVGLGVRFQEGVEVLDLIHENQEFKGLNIRDAQGKITTIFSQEAVLCGGAWSSQIVKEIPIFPVKGQMLSLQGPKKALQRIIFGPGTYLVPREDGLVVVGATNEKMLVLMKDSPPLVNENSTKESSLYCLLQTIGLKWNAGGVSDPALLIKAH